MEASLNEEGDSYLAKYLHSCPHCKCEAPGDLIAEYEFYQRKSDIGWLGLRHAQVYLVNGSYVAKCEEPGAKGEAMGNDALEAVKALREKVSS